MRGPFAKGLALGLEATSWALGGLAKVVAGASDEHHSDDGRAPAPTGPQAGGTAGPQYVDYGALMTPPAPFTSMNTSLWGFWARADGERIAQLCDKVFAQPTAGAVRARPLSDYLMLTWGRIEKVVSQTPPYDQRGGVAEPQVAVWIPVALRDPGSRHERFAMFVPYLWLSNPMSLATGRELFGYPKSGGMPEFPTEGQRPQTWKLSVFGLEYSPGSTAEWGHSLLEVVQNQSAEVGAEAELDSLADLARDAGRRLFDNSAVTGDFEIAESLIEDVVRNRLPNVFLKQVRSVQDGLLAAFQQVTQADYEVTKLRARPVSLEHQLTVHRLDSHPVITELGLESQSLGLAYSVEMDFNVGDGRVLWDGASR
jgi:acetoacetate decarboxylase